VAGSYKNHIENSASVKFREFID